MIPWLVAGIIAISAVAAGQVISHTGHIHSINTVPGRKRLQKKVYPNKPGKSESRHTSKRTNWEYYYPEDFALPQAKNKKKSRSKTPKRKRITKHPKGCHCCC
ncbi:hypothetical protein [Circoviridae 8 LDMD-2013]|uniref:hypothetical protein n=1 Tax=Circoviridae 8 LDMD-2013 TaxID=1379712 RepID=UPI00038444D6|nr:hypothetical protein [Circoviridae 8 LDMD-2013]AGS36202.1 hypothetical protein [Circoviridae 8 LDMD-2013]